MLPAPSLQQFVDTEITGSVSMIRHVTRDLLTVLRAAVQSQTPAERSARAELALRVARGATFFEQSFVDALSSRLRAEPGREGEGVPAAAHHNLARLTLVDESRVEVDIELLHASKLFEAAAEWELRELQTFTSTLVGQTHVSAESNPLRPMVYAGALWDAACSLHPAKAERTLLLRLSAQSMALLLKRAWAAASTRLEAQGVTPGAYRSIVLPRGSGLPGAAPSVVETPTPGLRRLLPSAAPPSGPRRERSPATDPTPGSDASDALPHAAVVALDVLLRSLPTQTLSRSEAAAFTARLKAPRSALLASMSPTSQAEETVELLSDVFDVMLTDPELHPAFVPVVARLQIPALRQAAQNPAGVSHHAVWGLLDRIGEASAGPLPAADRDTAELLAVCHRIADEVVHRAASEVDVCGAALERLDGYLTTQWQSRRRDADAQVRQLIAEESPGARDALPAAGRGVPGPEGGRAPRESMIDLASLPTVPAALLPPSGGAPAETSPAERIAALRPGHRVRLFLYGHWSRVQLLWRSDRGEFLLFAGEAVGETHCITRRALERLGGAALLRPLEDMPLSQRAFETLERRLGSAGGR